MLLYHGSNTIVETPRILIHGHFKDFGYGFYCTELEKQAARWALTKQPTHLINVYDYEEDKNLHMHQIVFCTEKSLSTLKFNRSVSL